MPATISKKDPQVQKLLKDLHEGLAIMDSARTESEEMKYKDVVAREVAKQMSRLQFTNNDNYDYSESRGIVAANEASAERFPGMYDLIHKSDAWKTDDRVRRLMDYNDIIYLTSKMLGVPPEATKLYQQRRDEISELGKALNAGTATEGSDWVPTDLSAQVIDLIALKQVVANLFQEIPMPTNPFQIPRKTGRSTAYYVNEATTDNPNLFRASQMTTGVMTLTAQKFAVRVNVSDELTEDAVVAMLPLIREDIAQAISRAWEQALVDGDNAATHQDSDVTSVDDTRKAFDGLRLLTNASAKLDVDEDGVGTLDIEDFRTVRGLMVNAAGDAVYAANPSELAWLTSVKGSLHIMNKLKDYVTTLDKFPEPTIVKGTIAKFDGIDLFTPEQYRTNLNAAGVYDGSTTDQTSILCVYKPGFVIGTRRALKIESDRVIGADQNIMVATTRRDFQARYTTSDYAVSQLIGVQPA